MSTKVEKRIVVDVPVSTAYNQWTRFEDFPRFMGGVESVTRLGKDRLEWVAHIAGVRRRWEARILEQIPDRKVAWASTEGPINAGEVGFEDAGSGRTTLQLTLEYQPEGLVEKVGDLLHVVARQTEHDLKKFKAFIEGEGHAAGAPEGTGAGDANGAPAAGGGTEPEYNRFAHPFDQTGGLVDFEGESDGTAEGESHSAAERREQHRRSGLIWRADGTAGKD